MTTDPGSRTGVATNQQIQTFSWLNTALRFRRDWSSGRAFSPFIAAQVDPPEFSRGPAPPTACYCRVIYLILFFIRCPDNRSCNALPPDLARHHGHDTTALSTALPRWKTLVATGSLATGTPVGSRGTFCSVASATSAAVILTQSLVRAGTVSGEGSPRWRRTSFPSPSSLSSSERHWRRSSSCPCCSPS